ncbi:phosphate transporter [Thalictrum thalictroides]|uniref:Phosphate transporter n=1 Tax=Thalictrum thalictroides TaxID=46969 RepID=A0A7J6W8S1_THATH|nr:phosphate transporter [Thalictrum thalictroides]
MFGAIPAALAYYWHMKMPETARYAALVAKNAKLATSDMSKAGAIIGAFGFLYAAQSQDKNKTDAGYPPVPELKGRSLEDLSGENAQEGDTELAQQTGSNRTIPV